MFLNSSFYYFFSSPFHYFFSYFILFNFFSFSRSLFFYHNKTNIKHNLNFNIVHSLPRLSFIHSFFHSLQSQGILVSICHISFFSHFMEPFEQLEMDNRLLMTAESIGASLCMVFNLLFTSHNPVLFLIEFISLLVSLLFVSYEYLSRILEGAKFLRCRIWCRCSKSWKGLSQYCAISSRGLWGSCH